jgi:hypothetical protein
MSATFKDGVIHLQGVCPIEDAEVLLRGLLEHPGTSVDWSGCEQAHGAVIQVLMAARPVLVGYPTNPFLRRHLTGLLSVA